MQIYQDLKNYSSKKPLALSLGMFDGVHLGHQSILTKLNKIAHSKGLESGILTFWPHPRLIFNPEFDLKLLNNYNEKIQQLENNKIQNLFLQNFDEDFRNLTGEEFVKQILIEKLNVKHLIIGHDHTFGKDKSGDFSLLQKMSLEYGFEVQQLEAIQLEHTNISSTKIRNSLLDGDILKANEMLGYYYPISGKVVHGKKIGRTIGFPTANVEINPHKLLPKKGAYIVDVIIDEKHHHGMASIGTNPTVNGTVITLEAYILDFNEDIYDKNITLHFRDFLHEEIKFSTLENLIVKLKEDEVLTRKFFEKLN
ncbi:bifunctional riboflavin kinase/FAD synthetase [Frigoriflavimonas asaccharolytica]|uniref:Riboflavin biosynthesis protein n=1 Tax=Frigoriflavimonas asaccharolytica TaxID=2735899 RepID=A0A8J8K5I9_9FLAO|nr:bifunctional riboflavin kinase/FAD synthetase [Frigoriflavimonas asaccharolytica]NRS92835.1 riboflavin kinase/FMN adenylyltransferase [Frigoriflavimonas asaccharolytica]